MMETGASQQMGTFRMGESGKVEVWAEEQVEAIEEIEAESTLNLARQRLATSAMAKVIWLMFAQVNLRVKLSRHAAYHTSSDQSTSSCFVSRTHRG